MRTDGQTDKKKLIVAFRNFATLPKNGSHITKFGESYKHTKNIHLINIQDCYYGIKIFFIFLNFYIFKIKILGLYVF